MDILQFYVPAIVIFIVSINLWKVSFLRSEKEFAGFIGPAGKDPSKFMQFAGIK
jgi:hypothetical protein